MIMVSVEEAHASSPQFEPHFNFSNPFFPFRSCVGGEELERQAAQFVVAPDAFITSERLIESFGRAAPLEIDLGCGDGRFLSQMARCYPDKNFLGVERQTERVRKTARKAVLFGCQNVRVVQTEILSFIRSLLPYGSVLRIHVLFPDPWPKRRHSKKRLLCPAFFEAAAAALAPGGEVRVKTDCARYFQEAVCAAGQCVLLEQVEWVELNPPIHTTFETRFLSEGLPLFAARWKRADERIFKRNGADLAENHLNMGRKLPE